MLTENLVAIAAEAAVSALVKTLIVPKIKSASKAVTRFRDKELTPFYTHFEEYLKRSYTKYSVINTLVNKNERKYLKDLYVPLTLVSQTERKNINRIDCFPAKWIRGQGKILITDTAGMGKSTLTKFMFLNTIDEGNIIPIYIELRRLSKSNTILQEVQHQLNSLSKVFDNQLMLDLFKTGGFIFFLDGYDEIALDERSAVTTDINDFISKASDDNFFILTSRPEDALSCFGEFRVYGIRPLERKEAYELIRRYDLRDGVCAGLINELKKNNYETIKDFLSNPLLVSLLVAAYDYKQIVPLKKHIFYRQVYDAYFDLHDLSKGDSYIHDKKSGLDTDEFERVLRYVGFSCLKHHKIEFEKDALLNLIEDAKSYCPDLKFNASDFLSDLLHSVPLFCMDGSYYKWVHKSLQEYFAAQFIYKDSKNSQAEILSALCKSENAAQYVNLLDIYFDVDNWGFTSSITLPLCEAFLKYHEESFFNSEIINKDEIDKRIGYLFLREIVIVQYPYYEMSECFDVIKNRVSGVMTKMLQVVSNTSGEDIYVASAEDPMLNVVNVLRKRQPELFSPFEIEFYSLHDKLSKDSIICINPRTGEESLDLYKAYNSYLRPRIGWHMVLDYNKCEDVAQRIRKEIEKRQSGATLTAGL